MKAKMNWNGHAVGQNPEHRDVFILLICLLLLLLPALMPSGASAWPIPDTGQTKCYNNTAEIPCPQPGEAFYGQDGNYSINPPSYTKLDASGAALPDTATAWVMVKDNVTGLIWENKTNDGSIHDGSKTFTWCDKNPANNGGNQGLCGTGTGNLATDTEAFIKAMNDQQFGGFSDWRMPNVKELSSLVNSSTPYPGPVIDASWFPHTLSSYYWAATTHIHSPSYAWVVGFTYGDSGGDGKPDAHAVRAVRGGQSGSLDHLVINGDGTVSDTATGLMWQQGTASGKNWESALAYAEGLSLADYDDWRLPTATELQTIVDFSRYNPAIDTTFFPNTLWSDYWSSTSYADYPDYAWCVRFDAGGTIYISTGGIDYSRKANAYDVRSVRGGQARSLGSLVISAPVQGGSWTVGKEEAITWDTAGISGNVKISLSRQGGKTGSFTEAIAESVPNNGSYAWTVTGLASVNSALKIEPVSNAAKSTIQSLFTIQEAGTGGYALTVAKAGAGSGAVSSNPTGIDCGSDCNESYNSGTSIALTAAPDAGSTFTGWTGCDSTNGNQCTVAMTAARNVTASFDLITGSLRWTASGLGTSDIVALAIAPTNPDILYAGDGHYIYKTINAGGNWNQVYFGAAAYCFAINPANADAVYAGKFGYEVLKTINGGVSWVEVGSAGMSMHKALAIDPMNTSTVYLGVKDGWGLYKTTTGGASWNNVLPDVDVTSLAVGLTGGSPPKVIYAGTKTYFSTPGGVYKSADDGATWTRVMTHTQVNAVAVDPTNPDVAYAGTEGDGVFKSADGGATWAQVNTGLAHNIVRVLTIDPNNPGIVYAGTWEGGVYRSVNGGSNWSAINAGLTNTYIQSLVIHPANPDVLYAGTQGNGVFKSSAADGNQTLYSLSLTKTGAGSGTVTSNPSGINCGVTCSGTYASGASVTLTATPDAGSTFAGWGGDCSGTGTCTLSMLGNRNVTATFNLIPTDTTPPIGAGVVINSGAASTGATQVTLTLSATDAGSGMGQMKFSSNGTDWSTPVPFAATASWILAAGDGQKTVYALFSDGAGNWMASPVSVTILLQTQNAPGNPAALLVESTTNSAISLKWNKNLEAGAVYHVFRSQPEGGIFYPVNTAAVGDESLYGGKLLFTDRGLKEGTTYYYKIQAVAGGVASAGFSNVVSARTAVIDDYQVVAVDPTNIVNVGSAVKYYLQLLPKDNLRGTINLSCSGVSEGLIYEFFVNNENRGSSVSGISPPASVVLQITAGSATAIREHRFDVITQNVWSGGASDLRHTPMSLTVVARDGAGIHAEIEKPILRKGEKVKIYGSILPPVAGKTVVLTLASGGGGSQTRNVMTTTGGRFEDTDWISTLPIGSYEITAAFMDAATWHTSDLRAFTVEKGGLVLTCLRQTGEQAAVGGDFTILGTLKPAIAYAQITLRAIDPDGNVADRTFAADGEGQYLRREPYFTKNGLWKFRTYFTGNDDTIGAESDDLIVPVGIDFGRAIILGGGEAEQSNTYWEVTKKLTVAAYRDFKAKGFLRDMIYYLINSQAVDINYDDIPDDVVNVTIPTVNAFLDAIRARYATVLNAQTPLFIYMQGHATQDKRFKILGADQYLTSVQLKDALDKLQGVGAYQGQGGVESNVIVIIEACYSGNFIADLSGPKRVIVTSAGNEPYNTDASGHIAFSRRLFSKLLEGDSLKKAFDYARSAQVNMNYPAPRLDDNGDGTENQSDGLLAANIHLNGALTWGLKPVIGAGAVDLATVIEGAASTPIAVNVTKGDVSLERVWAQIIAPNANIGGGTATIAYPETALTLNAATQRYEGTLAGLTVAGIYKIVVLARDVNKEVSDPALAYITVASPPMPGDVNGDENVTLADAILALRAAAGLPLATGSIRPDFAAADVNGDKKIGLAEVIYILQKAAGLR